MTEIILLVGRTGGGKSSLANVLSGKENASAESENSASKTKEIQEIEFEHKGGTYQLEKCQIVDSIGIGDTRWTQAQVLSEISKVWKGSEGKKIKQVLFVVGERLTPEEVNTYNLLKEVFFDGSFSKYTTIIRTRFASFEDEEECEKHRQILLGNSNKEEEKVGEDVSKFINELIKEGSNKIIYVDNPPVSFAGEGKTTERQRKLGIETRKNSREVLLEKLVSYESVYKPENLDDLNRVLYKEWIEKKILKETITKEFIQHVNKRVLNLDKEIKDGLEEELNKVEEKLKLTKLKKEGLDRKAVEESKSYDYSSSDWRSISKKGEERDSSLTEEKNQGEVLQTKVNLQSKLGNQFIKELKELVSYFPENKQFAEWKKEINKLREEIIGNKEKKLVSEIIADKKNVIKVLEENIEEKKKHLQEVKNNNEKKNNGNNKKEQETSKHS